MTTQYLKLLVVALFFAGLFMVLSGMPTQAEAADTGCITAQCHSTLGKVKYTHGPIVDGECETCHGTSTNHAKNPKNNTVRKEKIYPCSH
jgi:predicted CXXCH cytochrome family protein